MKQTVLIVTLIFGVLLSQGTVIASDGPVVAIPESYIMVDTIDTSCQLPLSWSCSGYPVQCNNKKEVTYCPLSSVRDNLFIDQSIKTGENAYVVNIVIENDLFQTWVVKDPEVILKSWQDFPTFFHTVYIQYENQ